MSQFNFDDIAIFESKKYRGEDKLTLSQIDEMSMRPEKPLRVKIIKTSNGYKWYHNNIGNIYEVKKDDKRWYEIIDNKINNGHYILQKDCEIIKEEQEEKTSLSVCFDCKYFASKGCVESNKECIEKSGVCHNGICFEHKEEQSEDWQKLLNEAKKHKLSDNQIDELGYDTGDVTEIIELYEQVISLMEKEIKELSLSNKLLRCNDDDFREKIERYKLNERENVIEWLKEFAEYKRPEESNVNDGMRAKRLLQQLNKE